MAFCVFIPNVWSLLAIIMAADFRKFWKCSKITIISEFLDRDSVLPKITIISEFSERLSRKFRMFDTPVFFWSSFEVRKSKKSEIPGKSKAQKFPANTWPKYLLQFLENLGNFSIFYIINIINLGKISPFFVFNWQISFCTSQKLLFLLKSLKFKKHNE